MVIHVVTAGETVYSIAEQYGVGIQNIADYNGLEPPYQLAVGQTLVILFPQLTHTVQQGETLYSIAEKYGMTYRELLRNNPGLQGRFDISPGQQLVLSFTEPKRGSIYVNSYAYPFVDIPLLERTVFYLTYLTPFTYGITADGSLVLLDDEQLIQISETYGTAPLMHLSTLTESGVFDTQRATVVLNDAALREKLTEEIVAVLGQKGYVGLDVDFEFVGAENAAAYADFVQQLHDRLSPLGYLVIVALAPKTYAEQPGLLYAGHDYAALAAAADAVLLMTYEWGYTYGPPLAVAPLPSVRRVLDYAITEIPPEKIYLGIPNYGYNWTLPFVQGETKAESIPNAEAYELATKYRADIQFDENYLTPYFYYTDEDGRAHEVWFEDGRSIKAKLELIAEYGFLGAGYWNMMRPFQQGWSILNAMYDIRDHR